MRRNAVAIVGSAGAIPHELRRTVEALARSLGDAGFDLVTGSMDGVMRAVARGHGLSSSGAHLVHIEPGWGRAWERNPHPAGVVRTGLGSMRNHLVVRSADLVVAVSGGSGTLSEMAIAWQEGKPIAALRGSGGWSDKLADTTLDRRRGKATVTGCDTVDEVVAWADRLRPEGVYAGRVNQGFYPLEAPALHRVHEGAPDEHHRVHLRYGMSIGKSDLVQRLEELNRRVESWNREHDAATVALVTFDDGWKDVTRLAGAFENLPCLCPVLFVGENHFEEPMRPLPLQRLYHHCAVRGLDPEDAAVLGGVVRTRLKSWSEAEQHLALDRIGIDPMLDPDWLLTPGEIASLESAGWVVGTHGHRHEDLSNRAGLGEELSRLAESVEDRGHTPWLAWPEGRWSQPAWASARAAGFRLQFGLLAQPCEGPCEGMVMRRIWRGS